MKTSNKVRLISAVASLLICFGCNDKAYFSKVHENLLALTDYSTTPDSIMKIADSLIAVKPRFPDAYILKAKALVEKDNTNKGLAILAINEGLKLRPKDAGLIKEKIVVLIGPQADSTRIDRASSAPSDLELHNAENLLSSIKESEKFFYNLLSGIIHEYRNLDSAFFYYQIAESINPNSIFITTKKIDLLLYKAATFNKDPLKQVEIYKNIIEELSNAIKRHPNNVYLLNRRGRMLKDYIGDYSNAIEDFEHCQKFDKDNFSEYQRQIGNCHYLNGEIKTSIEYYTSAINEGAQCYEDRASAYISLRMFQAAINDIDREILFNHDNDRTPFLINGIQIRDLGLLALKGLLLKKLGRTQEAQELLNYCKKNSFDIVIDIDNYYDDTKILPLAQFLKENSTTNRYP